jgi:hypothetical protein
MARCIKDLTKKNRLFPRDQHNTCESRLVELQQPVKAEKRKKEQKRHRAGNDRHCDFRTDGPMWFLRLNGRSNSLGVGKSRNKVRRKVAGTQSWTTWILIVIKMINTRSNKKVNGEIKSNSNSKKSF